jgi:hypothetical protein
MTKAAPDTPFLSAVQLVFSGQGAHPGQDHCSLITNPAPVKTRNTR